MLDWRKASDYNFPADLPQWRWAWEFLRRNPDYRRDWHAALGRFLAGEVIFEGYPAATEEADGPDDPRFALAAIEAERWRLRLLLNPETDDPEYPFFEDTLFGVPGCLKVGETVTSRGQDFPIVVFNLNLPLKPQLETCESFLRPLVSIYGVKPRNPKNHRSQWAHYLRLLDADLDKRTPKQIADQLQIEQIGIDEKKIWYQIKAAKKLTLPPGYVSILLS